MVLEPCHSRSGGFHWQPRLSFYDALDQPAALVWPAAYRAVLVLGILAEFPQLEQLVDTLQAWFAGLDILVALAVIVVSLVAGDKTRPAEFRD